MTHLTVFTLFSVIFGSLMPIVARAQCSRPLNVPVSAFGYSLLTQGKIALGIYPDLLRSIGIKSSCSFTFSMVPRARQEFLFEHGMADLLIPAIKTRRRDAFGIFVPLIVIRATLISIRTERPTITNMQDLIKQSNLKLVLVRGFEYGENYQNLIQTLAKDGRVLFESEPIDVVRVLQSALHYATIMPPGILLTEVQNNPQWNGLKDQLRLEPLTDLPWSESGVYISKASVTHVDRALLQEQLEKSSKSGDVWRAFERHYSREILNLTAQQLRLPN
jgi:polar amino acid transport system substrate-binding protein